MSAKAMLATAFIIVAITGAFLGCASRQAQAQIAELNRDFDVLHRLRASSGATCKELDQMTKSLAQDTNTAFGVIFAANSVKGSVMRGCTPSEIATQRLGALKASFRTRIERENTEYWALRVIRFVRRQPDPHDHSDRHFDLAESGK